MHVADDEIGNVFLGQHHAAFAVLRHQSREAEHVQRLFDDHANFECIVNDQNFFHSARADSKQLLATDTNDCCETRVYC